MSLSRCKFTLFRGFWVLNHSRKGTSRATNYTITFGSPEHRKVLVTAADSTETQTQHQRGRWRHHSEHWTASVFERALISIYTLG
jgi:hypothetical protein